MRTRAVLIGALLTATATAACGGGTGGEDAKAGPTPTTEASPGVSRSAAEPVQLRVDPCALVTKAEAEAIIGPANDSGHYEPPKCIYTSSQNTGGQIAVSLTEPQFCKFLVDALDTNTFGGVQVRRDDVGDGGVLVTGLGNVQFTAGGGCAEVAGTVNFSTKIDDDTIVRLAKTAAERVV
jgi:hypothetical protein